MSLQRRIELLGNLQDNLVRGLSQSREAHTASNIVTLYHPSQSLCWFNQSIPLGDIDSAGIDLLEQEHVRRGREPFFEFCADLWPNAERLLRDKGYERIMDGWLMVHDRSVATPISTAVAVNADHLPSFWHVGAKAFDSDLRPHSEESILKYLESLANKEAWAAVMLVNGEIVSVGEAIGTLDAAEIAGIGTLHNQRRQGYAGNVVWRLLADYYDSGGKVAWLGAGNEPEQRLYANLGFETAGRTVGYLKPTFKPG